MRLFELMTRQPWKAIDLPALFISLGLVLAVILLIGGIFHLGWTEALRSCSCAP